MCVLFFLTIFNVIVYRQKDTPKLVWVYILCSSNLPFRYGNMQCAIKRDIHTQTDTQYALHDCADH